MGNLCAREISTVNSLTKTTRFWEKADPLSEDVINFFTSVDQLFSPPYGESCGIKNTLQLIAEKGGALIKKDRGRIVGLSCYSIGEPVKDYKNNDVLYVIFVIFEPKERNKKSIIVGYLQALYLLMEEGGYKEIRFKARENDSSLNRMYQKIGRFLYQEKNLKNILCNVYTIDKLALNNWV